MKTIRLIVISAILAIALVCLGWYFITSFNSIRVYRIHLDSENFWINDGFFMKSNMKNVFQLTDLKYIGKEKLKNSEFRAKIYVKDEENKDELIIYDGVYASPIYIYEADGYDEYFSERYANLLKDNLYVDISYLNNDGEVIRESHKLETTLEFANNKLLELKESSKEDLNVSESVNNFQKRKVIQEKLMDNDYEICAENNNLAEDCFIRDNNEISLIVHISDDIVVNVHDFDINLYYSFNSNLVRLMNNGSILYNGEYSESLTYEIKDKNVLSLLKMLKECLVLLK